MRTPTLKQCPGCKAQKRFYTGDVCYECEQKIKLYAGTKEALEIASGNRKTCKVHFGEYLPIPMATVSLQSAETLSKALANLVRALAPCYEAERPQGVPFHANYAWNEHGASKMPVGDNTRMPVHNSEYDMTTIATVPVEFGEAYSELMHRLGEALRESERKGQIRGQNLLMQLNDGELSMADFNERLSRAQNGR